MGSARPRPEFLAKKLLLIRRNLGISQQQLLTLFGVQDQIDYTYISKYELNKNEPPFLILLTYARLPRVPVDDLIDDEIELDAFIQLFRRRATSMPDVLFRAWSIASINRAL